MEVTLINKEKKRVPFYVNGISITYEGKPCILGVGIDISQLMIDYATNLARSQELANVRFQVMDATQSLQFPDHTFDLVFYHVKRRLPRTEEHPCEIDTEDLFPIGKGEFSDLFSLLFNEKRVSSDTCIVN